MVDPADIPELHKDGACSAHQNFLQLCNFKIYMLKPVVDGFSKGCHGIHSYALLPSF